MLLFVGVWIKHWRHKILMRKLYRCWLTHVWPLDRAGLTVPLCFQSKIITPRVEHNTTVSCTNMKHWPATRKQMKVLKNVEPSLTAIFLFNNRIQYVINFIASFMNTIGTWSYKIILKSNSWLLQISIYIYIYGKKKKNILPQK